MAGTDFRASLINRFRKKGSTTPPLEGAYVYLLAVLVGYLLADFTVLQIRPLMLPDSAPPAQPAKTSPSRFVSKQQYRIIEDRNIFNVDGKIPPALASEQDNQDKLDDRPAVLSQLPLKLLGTIVHFDPEKSVGTINASNRNETQSYKVGDEVNGIARITLIERRKVTFRNLNNNRLEYIEIPEDAKIAFGMSAPKPKEGASKEIMKEGKFNFVVKRSTLDKYTSNLSSILRQARMVPNVVPGSGGEVEGFRFVSIEPGSIFETMGFKINDVIKSVEGESVNSPTKAMELYNTLKTSNRVALVVERDGAEENFQYTID